LVNLEKSLVRSPSRNVEITGGGLYNLGKMGQLIGKVLD